MRRPFLVAEAFAALALASMLIALFSFRRIATLAAHGQGGGDTAPADLCRDMAWALAGISRRVPWRAVCFQQGLAAQLMLRRRGHAAALHYGARRDDSGKLVAHVWLTSGDTDVIGCENAASYGLLAVFPPLS